MAQVSLADLNKVRHRVHHHLLKSDTKIDLAIANLGKILIVYN